MQLALLSRSVSPSFRNGWGGPRRGAGRPRNSGRGRVPHVKRAEHRAYWPVLVTLRTTSRDLRSPFVFPTVRGAIASSHRGRASDSVALTRAEERDGEFFHVCEYSVQGDHIHLLAEASSTRALQRGVRGLSIRLAKRVNQVLFQKGRLITDRYHARVLKSPRAVRNALVYVFGNFRKHGHARAGERIDLLSSAPYSRAFSDLARPGREGRTTEGSVESAAVPPVKSARTWLLAHGWRQHGLISVWEAPRDRGQPGGGKPG